MTREETIDYLNAVVLEIGSYPSKPAYGLAPFRLYSLWYEKELLETALKHNIDPDSVYFSYEIRDGKGTPFKEKSK